MLTIAPELKAGPSVADTGVSPPVQRRCLLKLMVYQKAYHLQNDYTCNLSTCHLLFDAFYIMVYMGGAD